jgi:hypothetical protein
LHLGLQKKYQVFLYSSFPPFGFSGSTVIPQTGSLQTCWWDDEVSIGYFVTVTERGTVLRTPWSTS